MDNQESIYFAGFNVAFGRVYLAKSTFGVCRISFPCITETVFLRLFFTGMPRCVKHTAAGIKMVKNEAPLQYEIVLLMEYFRGKEVSFDFPLDLRFGSPFQRKVWNTLREIPYGERRSYKWVAERVGNPGAARAVGMANNKNPLPPVIPCHRVIGSDGSLTGYASGLHVKRALLSMEEYTSRKGRGLSDDYDIFEGIPP